MVWWKAQAFHVWTMTLNFTSYAYQLHDLEQIKRKQWHLLQMDVSGKSRDNGGGVAWHPAPGRCTECFFCGMMCPMGMFRVQLPTVCCLNVFTFMFNALMFWGYKPAQPLSVKNSYIGNYKIGVWYRTDLQSQCGKNWSVFSNK